MRRVAKTIRKDIEMPEKLYTVDEAAEATRLSVAWWRQAIFQRKIKYLKLSRRVLIPESTIQTLLETSVVPPRRA
jgi:excisionase family DNA binding protein